MENSAADKNTKGTRVGRTTCVFHPLALTQFRATDLTDIKYVEVYTGQSPNRFQDYKQMW